MTNEQFDEHVMDILARELGPGGYARYLMLHRSGEGNYTAERQQWQDARPMSLDEIWHDLEAQGLTQKA